MANILVVDNSPSIRELVCETLSEMGHQTFQAKDGLQALAEVERRRFDAVITDYHMPGMDGIELIGKLRQLGRFKSKPILVLSTERDPAIKQKAKDAGAAGFGNKPLDVNTFKTLVARLLP